MSEITEPIKEQIDTDEDECTVSLDCDSEEFKSIAIPYAVGYMSSTHGLTDVEYYDKTLTFERLA